MAGHTAHYPLAVLESGLINWRLTTPKLSQRMQMQTTLVLNTDMQRTHTHSHYCCIQTYTPYIAQRAQLSPVPTSVLVQCHIQHSTASLSSDEQSQSRPSGWKHSRAAAAADKYNNNTLNNITVTCEYLSWLLSTSLMPTLLS